MTTTRRLSLAYLALTAGVAVLFALNLFWGSVSLTPGAVAAALLGRGEDALAVGIVLQLRLPRAVMVVLLGAALSAAGYLLQTFFANPIAGPFVMGVSSGAKLAVALTMVVFLQQGLLTGSATLIIAAFAGSMAAMAFVLVVARRVPRMSILVICGIMIGYICSAVTDIVVTFAQDSNIVNLHNWSMGSFSGMTWANVGAAACVVLPALAAAFPALEAHGGLPDGRELRQERRRTGAGLLDGPRAAVQPAFRLRDGLCRPHLLCGHRGAASGQEPAGQRKAPLYPAGLLSGRGSVLPALRPHRPQPVRAH